MSELRRIRSAILCVLLLMGLSVLAADVDPIGPMTVDEAVTFALQQNPAIARAAQDVAIAQAQVVGARASREPNFNLGVSSVYTPEPTKVTIPGPAGGAGATFQLGNTFADTMTLTGTLPVWPRERWRAPIAVAEANVGVTGESLVRARQQVVFQTRQAFYQLVTAQELLQVADGAVAVAEQQLKLAQNTVAAGMAAPLDVFQARAVLADAQVNQAKAQNGVDLARAALAMQMGLPPATPVAIAPPAAGALPVAPAKEEVTAAALQSRPELTQLAFRRKQQEAAIELIKLQKRPSVNLSANYAKPVLSDAAGLGASGLSVTASVGMNLYNGGKTDAELAAARVQLAQIDTAQRQLELGISLEVRQAWLSLDNASKQLTAAQEQERAAREAHRIAELRYREGEGIILEVEQARLKLTQAQTAVAQARLQAFTAEAQLQYAVGAPVG